MPEEAFSLFAMASAQGAWRAMMRQYELVERVLSYDPNADEALLNRAYVYAMKAHGTQKRASGDPYFSHPLEVAAILTELKLDDATIVAALLHDVIEDTDVTRAEIDQKFGKEIGALVEGLTKIKPLDLVTKKAEQAENFRKLLVAISSDIRVLLIKLADRLHNMRTLEHMKPESRRRISEETLEIYAPLAGRMGMQAMREELEELRLQLGLSRGLRRRRRKLADIRKSQHRAWSRRSARRLRQSSPRSGLNAEVYGREKKPFSIWRKMENRQISLEQLSDIYGFRVVVDSIDACYRALGVVHSDLARGARPLQGLHLDAEAEQLPVDPHHRRRDRAISGSSCRSAPRDMHDIAEYGVAAHALYKDGRLNGKAAGAKAPAIAQKDSPLHLAAPAGRYAARGRQPRGVPRAHQARAVPGPGVLLHAQRAPHRAAARCHPDRLRLCRAHRRRQLLRRRRRQRPAAAARPPSSATATRWRS